MTFLEGIKLTVKGIEYLNDHSAAMKAYKGLKELRDWLPFQERMVCEHGRIKFEINN